jgi:hypothetical protein
MSQRIKDNNHFINLLLNTNKKQSIALIKSIDRSQTDALTEIIYNIFNLSMNHKVLQKLNKRKALFKKVTNKKSYSRRKQIIYKHRYQIIDTLNLVKDKLMKIIQ